MNIVSAESLVQTRLGENIAVIRDIRGLTRGMLAEATRIGQSRIIEIEEGRRNPTLKTLLRISMALDVEISLIFFNCYEKTTRPKIYVAFAKRLGI